MANKQGFTKPRLYDCGGDIKKEWYVSFRMTCPCTGERKPFPYRFGINYLQTKAERYKEASAIIKLLDDALLSGWNPFVQDIKDFLNTVQSSEDESKAPMSLVEAIQFALQEKRPSLAKKSVSTYKTVVEVAAKAASNLKLDTKPVGDIKRSDIKLLLSQMAKERQAEYDRQNNGKQFTGNNYNKYKDTLRALFTELEDYELVEYNPCKRISAKPKIKTNIHRQATEQERAFIREHLPEDDPRLFIYLMYEFHSGMRPKEIFGLKICDIDWFNQSFDLHADNELSKTREQRKVPIPNVLMKYIESQRLELYDPNDHIFSINFLPGPQRIKRDAATKRWKRVVKDGYGLNVTLYSFKGLGGENKRNAGISKKAVSKGSFGHTNEETTMIYLPTEQDRINKEIIENTPDF